jgi:hypothetical protein
MTVGELLAMLGVKDPKALAESLEELNKAIAPVLVELAGWGQRLTSAMKRYVDEMTPETRAMLEGFARAHAEANGDPSAAPWWMQPHTISLLPDPATTASNDVEVAELRTTVEKLQAKMEAMEARAGRTIVGMWTGKKPPDDPN